MPSVKIYNVMNETLDSEIDYEFGDETLRDILDKYEKKIGQESKKSLGGNRWNVSFGEDRFLDKNLPLITCLEYGDSMIVSSRNDLTGKIDQEINVKTLTEKTISIKANPSDTVENLKEEIYDIEGIPTDNQRLICPGRSLEDDKQLSYYGITNESTIYVVQSFRGGGFSFANVSEEGN